MCGSMIEPISVRRGAGERWLELATFSWSPRAAARTAKEDDMWRNGLLTATMLAALACAMPVAQLHAAHVRHMHLRELVANADRIVRGTVTAKDDGTITVAGGTLPATVYRIRVSESLKGPAAGGDTIEVRLLARPKDGGTMLRRGTVLQDLPQFHVGDEYLLMLTRPSAVGLSTTVGLQQGRFELHGRGAEEVAINGANNAGLLDDPSVVAGARARGARAARPLITGPIPYATLANEIRALVTK
jgi:hypothetical protein